MILPFTSPDLRTVKKSIFGAQKTQKRFNVMNCNAKNLTILCDVHASGGVVSHYFDNEAVRIVAYYQTLKAYNRLKIKNSDRIQLPSRNELLPHNTCCYLYFEWNDPKFVDWKIWYNRLASMITGINPTGHYLRYGSDQLYTTSVPTTGSLNEE